MKIYKIDASINLDKICKSIKVSGDGLDIMRHKTSVLHIFIKDLSRAGANILKQDALSVGADLISSRATILGGSELENALLLTTPSQAKKLAQKLKKQDFSLKELAHFLQTQIAISVATKPLLMGVLNFNDDSFNEASRASFDEAIYRINQMIDDGADIIDIGFCSSRPGSVYKGGEAEFAAAKPVLDMIKSSGLAKKARFSLDSFDHNTLRYALNCGFSIINDISGDTSLGKLASEFGAAYILMHKNGDPQTMQLNVKDCDILEVVDSFFAEKLSELDKLDIKEIWLDPGIGFGKTARDNMILTRHLGHFTRFNKPILYGASRKSVIDFYSPSKVADRLPGTLYLHLKAFENGAQIIRAHDIKEHAQVFKLANAYRDLEF